MTEQDVKAVLEKLLKENEQQARYDSVYGRPEAIEEAYLTVAKELNIEIGSTLFTTAQVGAPGDYRPR